MLIYFEGLKAELVYHAFFKHFESNQKLPKSAYYQYASINFSTNQ